MIDDPTAEDLEQLAHSVSMSGVLGDRDRLDVVPTLRRLAEIYKTATTENAETPDRTLCGLTWGFLWS